MNLDLTYFRLSPEFNMTIWFGQKGAEKINNLLTSHSKHSQHITEHNVAFMLKLQTSNILSDSIEKTLRKQQTFVTRFQVNLIGDAPSATKWKRDAFTTHNKK